MKAEPIIKRSFIKEHVFNNGSSVLNCTFDISELEKLADNGKIKIKIRSLKEPSQLGSTHIAILDDWKPDPSYSSSKTAEKEVPDELKDIQQQASADSETDLPF